MASTSEAIRLLNRGKSLSSWARRSTVTEVNRLAAELGVERRPTKAATVSAIERAPRPGVVAEGLDRVLGRRGIRRWGKAARRDEVEEVARRLGIDSAATKGLTLATIEAGAVRARTIQRQFAAFEARQDAAARRIAGVFADERRRLLEELSAIPQRNPYLRLRARRNAIDRFAARLARNLSRRLGAEGRDIHRQALTHLEALAPVARKAAEKALRRQQQLGIHSYSLQKFAENARDLLIRQAVLSHTDSNMAGPNSQLAKSVKNLDLVVKAEASRAYNEAQVAAGEHVYTGKGERVYKRIVEVFDARNHPFSRAASGMSVPIKDEFKVSGSEVARWGAVLRKSTNGIFWRFSGGFYVGGALPAHYNDRGFVVVEVR